MRTSFHGSSLLNVKVQNWSLFHWKKTVQLRWKVLKVLCLTRRRSLRLHTCPTFLALLMILRESLKLPTRTMRIFLSTVHRLYRIWQLTYRTWTSTFTHSADIKCSVRQVSVFYTAKPSYL